MWRTLYYFHQFSCVAGQMNRLDIDITKEYFEVECLENNQFKTVTWPTCKASKEFCILKINYTDFD